MTSECEGIVRGDYRSPNGTNRVDLCPNVPKFAVIDLTHSETRTFCGVHARRFRKFPRLYEVKPIEGGKCLC